MYSLSLNVFIRNIFDLVVRRWLTNENDDSLIDCFAIYENISSGSEQVKLDYGDHPLLKGVAS